MEVVKSKNRTTIRSIINRPVQFGPRSYYREKPCDTPTHTTETIGTQEICHMNRSAKTNMDKSYSQSTGEYLRNKCKSFETNTTRVIDDVNHDSSRGLYGHNHINCTNCAKPLVHRPTNPAYDVRGAVSSSSRLDRLKYETITGVTKNGQTCGNCESYLGDATKNKSIMLGSGTLMRKICKNC
jgi:hypothetical protein